MLLCIWQIDIIRNQKGVEFENMKTKLQEANPYESEESYQRLAVSAVDHMSLEWMWTGPGQM